MGIEAFETIFARAAKRKGGKGALEEILKLRAYDDRSPAAIAALSDDRILAEMTKRVFQAGFNWSVIEKKWLGFEQAFERFDVGRWTLMSDDDLDRLVADERIVRHAKKIQSVRDNAIFLRDLAAEHGKPATAVIAHWPNADYVGLLDLLKRKAARMGGTSSQYFLRGIGKESFVLGGDVVRALIETGVVEKAPTSKAALAAVQVAFNAWQQESGRSFSEISRILALSTGD
ncbi:MAG: DNA-3-methyladenine glycosylase I [Pseudomonadota bacterium]